MLPECAHFRRYWGMGCPEKIDSVAKYKAVFYGKLPDKCLEQFYQDFF